MKPARKIFKSAIHEPHPVHHQLLFSLQTLPIPTSWKTSHTVLHDIRVDLACPDHRIAILLPDSHWSRACRYSYRQRLNRLVAAGWRVFLFTVSDLRRSFTDCLSLIQRSFLETTRASHHSH